MWDSRFDKFVNRGDVFQENEKAEPENAVNYIDSDIGRHVGFNRVAVHYVVVPPHCRSSYPHAESCEEEFVLVLKGNPDLWLNGYIHQLTQGHAVGFPSGTGVAHTFINNTDAEIHLLVAGEKTKAENLCFFPINPELRETCKIWWGEAPFQEFGPHNGRPGPVGDPDKATASSKNIVFCPEVKRGEPFHYPGDNETFGNGFRITDKIGLKALGIWFEYLPPGRRSAFPHAHTHEEEFIYIIKGKPTIWMDGFSKPIEEEEFAAFPSNTGIGHTLINDSGEDVIYLCIGETQDFPDEKIYYPLNPLRNSECERKGWLWTDIPTGKRGPHSGRPQVAFEDHLTLRKCSEENANEVLEIFKDSPDYFLKVDGCHPNDKISRCAIVDGPKTKGSKYHKEFLLIEHNEKKIGVLDLYANHPDEGVCYLGLLLLRENLFGNGLGTKCYQFAEDYIKRSLDCKKIRLGVSDDNEVSGFWEKMGFKSNGNTYDFEGASKFTHVREYDKILN